MSRSRPMLQNDVLPRLERLLPRFRKTRIAVLGDLMLDRYLWGNANRLSPEAAVPVVDFVEQNDRLGGAANVAANLAALGAQVQLFGVVGGKKSAAQKLADDEAAAALRACLREQRIDDSGVLADPSRITTVKTRVIARHQQIVRIDHERRDPLSPATEEKLFRQLVAALKKLDALVISDYDKGLITDSMAERVLHAAHEFRVPVSVKPKDSRRFAYNGAQTIVCNAKEASLYVSCVAADNKSIEEAGRKLIEHFGSAGVVITRSEHGVSIFEESSPRSIHIPATSFERTYADLGRSAAARGTTGREVLDVTGAGDTVLSVITLAVAAGATLREAAFLANTAAGVVVGKLGTNAVSPTELSAALHDQAP